MPKVDVLNLVTTFSNGTADPVTISHLYDDVMFELARENWFVDARLYQLTRGQPSVTLGDDVVNILGIIWDDREIEQIARRQLESIDAYWPDTLGQLRSYVVEDVSKKDIALHSPPFGTSDPNLGTFGEPFGLDYPAYNLALFYSYAPL